MRQGYLQADRSDRAKAAGAAVVVHLLLGAALFTGLALHIDRKTSDSLATFDVATPRPPPPMDEDRREQPAKAAPAPAGKKANPSPIVAPPSKIPVQQAMTAAPVAGAGAASSAGAANSGSGTGAGGTGNGLGGGGRGGSGGGGRIGAMLIYGRLTNRDYRTIAGPDLPAGSAAYVLLVDTSGRVERCRPATSSGSARVDRSLCEILTRRLRFRPAMEADGRPLYQDVNYVARWGR